MGNDGHNKQRDLSYTQNRELSWLRFDERVLSESLDDTVPLFERLKFIAILRATCMSSSWSAWVDSQAWRPSSGSHATTRAA